MARREDYIFKFMDIRDALVSINQKVSLIGVILEFGFPKQSRGTDYSCVLKIIDASHPKPGIVINFFAERMEMLPQVMSPGDIVQIYHVVMKVHNKEVNGVFNKKLSSFALYQGKNGNDFLPYQCSPNFQQRDQDSKLIAGLRKWFVDIQLDEGSNDFLFLREIKGGKFSNLICKIVHVYEGDNNERTALVWDGTDCAPGSVDTKPADTVDIEIPLQGQSCPLPRDLICTFPTIGTILPITIDMTGKKCLLHLLGVGEWVKFLNIYCEVRAGIWHGKFTSTTRIRYKPNNDHLMLERQRSYEERLSMPLGRIPYWCFPWSSRITEVDYAHVPFVTLMDVLTYSEVTAKFKCIVRVVAAFPWHAENFYSHLGTYRIRLTIEDPTARIHAFLYAEDGEKFFGGHPPIEVLRRKRNKLLGVAVNDEGKENTDVPRDPPWVECCLKSYYLDKSNVWGSRHYRIFGTRNVG